MTHGPIYVQVRDEADVLDLIDSLKQDLIDAKQLLHELYDIRAEENKQIHAVMQRIEQINKRMTRIDEEVLA